MQILTLFYNITLIFKISYLLLHFVVYMIYITCKIALFTCFWLSSSNPQLTSVKLGVSNIVGVAHAEAELLLDSVELHDLVGVGTDFHRDRGAAWVTIDFEAFQLEIDFLVQNFIGGVVLVNDEYAAGMLKDVLGDVFSPELNFTLCKALVEKCIVIL